MVLGGCSTAQPTVDIDATVTAKVQKEISKLTPTALTITGTPVPTSTPPPQIIVTSTPSPSPTPVTSTSKNDQDNSLEASKARHNTASYNASLEGNYSLALTEIDKAMEIRTDWEDYYHRGHIYHMQNETELAIADYNYMISNAPRNISTYPWIIMSLVNRGILHGNSGGYESEIADFSQAIEYDLELKNLGEKTPRHYESWELYSNRCSAYAAIAEAKALEDCGKAADLNPSAYTFYKLAAVHAELDNHKTAIEYYSQVISLDPNDNDALYNRGKSYFKISEYFQAINDLSAVISRDPNRAGAYYNRARSYAILGDKEIALADINKAISLDNNPFNRVVYQEALELINSLPD